MAPWTLVTIIDGTGALRAAASLSGGDIVELPDHAGAAGAVDLIRRWDEVAGDLIAWDPTSASVLQNVRMVAPLLYPGKLICAGANYRDHLAEMGISDVPASVPPFFFLVPPTTTIIGNLDAIRLPADPESRADYEAELAVVIGRPGRDIPVEIATEHVAGYTIFNDVSARGFLRRADPLAPPFEFDWLGAKGLDTFCPMGPGVTPAWFIDDPDDLTIRCWVNDDLKQDASTSGMINNVCQLISAASQIMTLEPGDVIATGTPSGVGVVRNEHLRDGDTIRIEIDQLGQLVNSVTRETP
jgi:2-keto-4-pentenoate hydratase/2-oxohepta-3-ene-1,7-dioic acid hydratase in catechol pathway